MSGRLFRAAHASGVERYSSFRAVIVAPASLTDPELERELFDAASPQLRAVLTAMVETCCRPGENLSLQRL
jgi:hypothetical protein